MLTASWDVSLIKWDYVIPFVIRLASNGIPVTIEGYRECVKGPSFHPGIPVTIILQNDLPDLAAAFYCIDIKFPDRLYSLGG